MAEPSGSDSTPHPLHYTEPQRLSVRGCDIAYRRDGDGDPVLFLHSYWLTRRWTPFHAALAERVDLIAPELPGFGDSAPSAEHTTRPDMVLVLRDLLATLDVGSAHVVGYGLGAWLAADLAIWAPERVRSLAVIAPFGLRVADAPTMDVFLLDPARYAELYFNADALPDDVVPGPGTPADGGAEEFARRYGEMGAAAALVWSRRYDLKLEERVPRLAIPALVVGGGDDRIVPSAHLDAWTELLQAERVVLDGAPHAVLLQQPDAVAAALADFTKRSA